MTGSPDAAPDRSRDLELVRAVLSGKREARHSFAQRMECVPRYLSAANGRLGSPLNADDLADLSQDVLILIWSKLGSFEARASLETWAWRFCRLELLGRVRKVFRRRAYHGATNDAEDAAAPEGAVDLLEYEYLQEGLQALGPPEEEVIRLKHFGHLQFNEIANRLNLAPSTAKTRYYRGLSWLRSHLEKRGLGEDQA